MNKLFTLFKVELREAFSSNNSKRKKASFGVAIGMIGLLFAFLSLVYNFMFYMAFKEENKLVDFPLFMGALVILITLFSAIFRSQMILFSNKDHNILEPMPISKKVIVTSKLLLFLLEELIFSLIIYLPTIILYSLEDKTFILSGIVLMVTLPLLAILIAVIIGFVFNLLVRRFKFAKIILSILYVVAFVGIMAFSLFVNGNSNSEGISNMGESIIKYIPFLSLVEDGFLNGNILSIVIYLVIALGSTLVVILAYSYFYDSFYQMLQVNQKSEKYDSDKQVKANTPLSILIKKDIKNLLQSPMLLLNTIAGGIVGIIMVFFIVSQFDKITEPEAKPVIDMLYLLVPYLLGLLLTMSSVTSVSISAENKNFWIIKVLPINKKSYFASKLIVNQLILGSLGLVASIILIFLHSFDVVNIIMTILYPQLLIFAFGLFGIIINLLFPKLNWDNFNQIKNSSSVLITTFGGMLFNAIILVVSFFTINLFNGYLTIGINIIVPILLSIIFLLLLKVNSTKWLNNIEV